MFSDQLTIATWNVSPRRDHVKKWAHLVSTLRVDAALLQEASSSNFDLIAHTKRIHSATEHDRGTAFALAREISHRHVATLAGGDVVSIELPEYSDLLMVNVHSLRGRDSSGVHESDSSAMLHRCIPAIQSLLDSTRPILVAGDFNASIDLNYQQTSMRKVFQALRDLGLKDVLCTSQCALDANGQCLSPHERTFKRGSGAWRIDHMYANPALAERLLSASVDVSDAAWSLSDHRPIVARFAF